MDLEYSKAVGAAIRAARLARGMTQEQLAAKAQLAGCDLTRSALAKIECGQRSVYPDEVKALHEALQIPYEALLQRQQQLIHIANGSRMQLHTGAACSVGASIAEGFCRRIQRALNCAGYRSLCDSA